VKNRSRRRYDLLLALWPLGKYTHWLSKLPLLGPLCAGKTGTETNEAILLPSVPARHITVDREIGGTESVALPYPLLAPLIERASARTVLNECPCRRAERCTAYPRDVGCLLLGDGAAQIAPSLGYPASPGDALAHVRRAMDAGLRPTVLHSAIDAYLLDIPYRRMLAICFCCDCCCTVRHSLVVGAPGFADTVIRLPGLAVEVSVSCTGCGTCLPACPVQAISLRRPRQGADSPQACIDARSCKGCGRCVSACPVSTIHLHLSNQAQMLSHLLARVAQRTDIEATASTDSSPR
jgi:ferredoxin